jgi:hypothetical protein
MEHREEHVYEIWAFWVAVYSSNLVLCPGLNGKTCNVQVRDEWTNQDVVESIWTWIGVALKGYLNKNRGQNEPTRLHR